jgi:hypothetical protein
MLEANAAEVIFQVWKGGMSIKYAIPCGENVPHDSADDVQNDRNLPHFVPGTVFEDESRGGCPQDTRQHSRGVGHPQQHSRVPGSDVL